MAKGRHARPTVRRSRAPWVLVLAIVAVGAIALGRGLSSPPPTTTTTTTTTTTQPPLAMPPAVCTGTSCAHWVAVDTWDHHAPVYLTSVHPDGTPAGTVANVGWFRVSNIDLGLYLGYKGPGVTSQNRGPEAVPTLGRDRLLATFNSGFYEADNPAGFYTNHTLYFPMVTGEATLLRYRNGTLAMEAWPGGPIPANVVMARQNLTLLVDHGRATPASANNAAWGLTLHGVAAVWRSAIGLDAKGNLMYAAAPYETSQSMAALMVQLHAVTAMQLDINPEWPILVTYGGPNALNPSLDVANVNQISRRFLYSSTKDFFAVYATVSRGESTPW